MRTEYPPRAWIGRVSIPVGIYLLALVVRLIRRTTRASR
mgnify:CR=1 FL=1